MGVLLTQCLEAWHRFDIVAMRVCVQALQAGGEVRAGEALPDVGAVQQLRWLQAQLLQAGVPSTAASKGLQIKRPKSMQGGWLWCLNCRCSTGKAMSIPVGVGEVSA